MDAKGIDTIPRDTVSEALAVALYLERWSRELDIHDLLEQLIERAKKQIPSQ